MNGGAAVTFITHEVLRDAANPPDVMGLAAKGLYDHIAMQDGSTEPGDLVMLMVPPGDGQQVTELIWGVLTGTIKTLVVPTVERP